MGSLNSSLSYLITALNRDVWIHHRHTYQEANGYLLINHSYYSIYFVSIPISGDESKRTIKKNFIAPFDGSWVCRLSFLCKGFLSVSFLKKTTSIVESYTRHYLGILNFHLKLLNPLLRLSSYSSSPN